jgi:hypothetical protein
MLQLATLSTRGASGALDLLITRAEEQNLLASFTLPKIGSDRLGGHHRSSILDDRQLCLAYRRQLDDRQ